MTTFDLQELCDEANRLLAERNLQPSSGRANPVVTPRNVRYYQTLGLLPPVTRQGGRAVYGPEHVNAVVHIKEAQAEGVELRALQPEVESGGVLGTVESVRLDAFVTPKALALADVRFSPSPATEAERTSAAGPVELPAVEFGWSVDLGDGVRMTGTGAPPSSFALQQVIAALSAERLGIDDDGVHDDGVRDDEPF